MNVSRLISSPGHFIRLELILGVGVTKQLHADDGEDVDDDAQHQSQVRQCANTAHHDGQNALHCRPGLRQLEDSHQTQLYTAKRAHMSYSQIPELDTYSGCQNICTYDAVALHRCHTRMFVLICDVTNEAKFLDDFAHK